MTSFGAAIGAAIGPILAISAVIVTLVAAFKHLWETNEEFRNKITEIWDGIKQKFDEFVKGIVDRLNALGFDFDNFTEVVGAIWDAFCNLLAPVFEGVFSQISNIIGTVLDIITGILDVFIGYIFIWLFSCRFVLSSFHSGSPKSYLITKSPL